ncbi:hypothetical protein K505DRAFT_361223 [Melanomma pulvis-pyrius CBS 109.77]|uniref:Uncharacterized protein n=1 Tax=Melanomma pulvis-pyrius CBS 109.77 TaxID=1314802 RepID=A0A6A6XCW6_9PLEO|nr:hypothetical protein K505DRAFT_361223 [Melanomma pulvis-pyrius CBS 109.77]
MAPKRKAATTSTDTTASMPDAKKAKKAAKASRASAGGDDGRSYTSQQKSAITQFMSFTQADRNSAIRNLKAHAWNQEAAING